MSTFSQSLETDRPMNRLTTRLLELLEAAKQVHSLNIPTKTNKKSVEKKEEKKCNSYSQLQQLPT